MKPLGHIASIHSPSYSRVALCSWVRCTAFRAPSLLRIIIKDGCCCGCFEVDGIASYHNCNKSGFPIISNIFSFMANCCCCCCCCNSPFCDISGRVLVAPSTGSTTTLVSAATCTSIETVNVSLDIMCTDAPTNSANPLPFMEFVTDRTNC